MARPRKGRRVCMLPRCTSFSPKLAKTKQTVTMAIDEYEAIRLIDWEGMTQEECAARMGVARTTVQAIYASARKKLAECIVNGIHLKIDGGDYQICDGRSHSCAGCRKKHNIRENNDIKGEIDCE